MATSDRLIQGAIEWLEGVAEGGLHCFQIIAEPRPESLRIGTRGKRGFVYPGKLYAEFQHEALQQLSKQRPLEPLTGSMMAIIEVICTKPKTTIRSRPGGDFDNLAKGPCDALTQAGIWEDDDNVTSALVHKRWASDGEAAGVLITIGKV